jgi:hypothetical protein
VVCIINALNDVCVRKCVHAGTGDVCMCVLGVYVCTRSVCTYMAVSGSSHLYSV